jgi:hypothetical protein
MQTYLNTQLCSLNIEMTHSLRVERVGTLSSQKSTLSLVLSYVKENLNLFMALVFFLREIKNQRHEPLFYRGSNPKEEEFKMGISQKTITLGKKDQLLLATFPLSFFFLIEVLLWIKNVIIFFILFIKLI